MKRISLTVYLCTVLMTGFSITGKRLYAGQQWEDTGRHLARSTSTLVNMAVIPDQKGGSFMVFEDSPSGDADIYAQWIDASGSLQWGLSGVVVTSAGGDQKQPAVAPDGYGGAYVAWHDEVTTNIHLVRLDENGDPVWSPSEIAVCEAAGDQQSVKAISDGVHGVILVWVDERGADGDLYAQRINAAGSALWTADGVPVTTAPDNQSKQVIIGDGERGFYAAWQDYRSGEYDIYAQRVDSLGSQMWTPGGIRICTETDNQISPAADTSGSRLVVCWEDKRSGVSDIYAQSVNPDSTIQWTGGGLAVCTAGGSQLSPRITRSAGGGAIVVWGDNRNLYDIYAQKLSSAGTAQWTSNGLVVNASAQYQVSPAIATDDSGGAYIIWKDFRSGTEYGLYGQHVRADGTLLWGSQGDTLVAGDVSFSQDQYLISDESGGVLAFWQDERDSQSDVYGQHFNSNLTISEPAEGVLLAGDQSQTVAWQMRTQTTRFAGLTVRVSETPGDDYPVTAATGVNPADLSYSWTPSTVSSNTARLKIQGVNEDGAVVSEYTGPEFRVDSDPPSTFALTSPPDLSTVGYRPVFQWETSTDDISGLSHYQLYVAGGLVQDNITTNSYTLSELQALAEGDYTWTVKAVDNAGLVRDANQIWSITVAGDSDPPSPFSLLSPSNDSWLTAPAPVFTWQATSDAGTGLKKFQLYVDDQLEKDNISPGFTSVSDVTLGQGTHTWYVQAVDSASNVRKSIETWTIHIDSEEPDAFSIQLPVDGAWLQDTTPSFTWQASDDATSELDEYELWVDDNLLVDNIDPQLSSVTLSAPQALAEGEHAWYMVARDGVGFSTQSTETFTIGIDASSPAAFTLTAPANNLITTDDSPVFEWNHALDAVSDIDEYELWVNGALKKDHITSNSTTLSTPFPDGTLYWYVRAIDLAGNTRNSNSWSLTVDQTPPETFALLSPAPDEILTVNLVTFVWHRSDDPVSGLDDYTVYLDGQVLQDDISPDTTLSWPAPLDNGQHTWKVRARDNAGNTYTTPARSFTVIASVPEITSPAQAAATEDQLFTYTATADDPNDDPVSISFSDYPSWLTPSDHVISGTPGEGAPDTTFLVIATDGTYYDSLMVFLTVEEVNDPPVITSTAAAVATEDIAFTYTATADDPENSALSFLFEDYPGWLAPSGAVITGTPTEGTGDTTFTVIVSDGELGDTLEVTLTVQPVNDPPLITSGNTAAATEDVAFSYTATATDPENDPLGFEYHDYPSWLSPLDEVISGTPVHGDQDTSFRVIVWDGQYSDTLDVTVTVQPVNDPPVIISQDTAYAVEDIGFTYTAAAEDEENDTFIISFEDYPDWLMPSSNIIAGLPTEGRGDTSFTVIATDPGGSDTLKVAVQVQAVNDAPVITSAASVTATEDYPFTYVVTADDPDNMNLTVTWQNLPSWITASGDTITGTAGNSTSDTSFTVIVSDGSLGDTLHAVLLINHVNNAPVITSADSASATEDMEFTYRATYTDIDGPALTVRFKRYPAWLTPQGPELSGTPGEGCQDSSFWVIVSDGLLSDSVHVALTVLAVNDPPYFVYALPSPCFPNADTLRWELNLAEFAADPDDPDTLLVWSSKLIDPGQVTISIDNSLHTARFVVIKPAGDIRVLMTVKDPHGAAASDTLRIVKNCTGITEPVAVMIPDTYVLHDNFPNPFNPSTTIRYGLPRRTPVSLGVYNMLGRKVAQLKDEVEEAGMHEVIWEAGDLSSGIYFIHFQAGEFRQVKRMILMK